MTQIDYPTDEPPQAFIRSASLNYVWDINTLSAVKETQPTGGGGGGAVTIADGADTAQGLTSDAAWVSGSGTVISILKKIAGFAGLTDTQLRATAVPVSGTFFQATQPVSGTVAVSNFPATQPVSGTVTANAGSGTFTSKEVRAATPAQSSVPGSASSVTLLASNANRLGGTVYNDSTANLFLKMGATASTSSYTSRLVPNAYFEVPYGYTGVVDGIWASATGNARITELT